MPDPKPIYRFPRPPSSRLVLLLAEFLRQEPKALINISPDGKTLDFKFRVFLDPAACSAIFDSRENMQKALQTAFINGRWGHSPVPHAISLILGRICRDAIKGYLVDKYFVGGPEPVYRDYHAQIAEILQPLSGPITPSQPDLRLAKKLTNIYRGYFSAIRDVRILMKKNQMTDDAVLQELQKRIPKVDPRRALALISPFKGSETVRILRARISNAKIARAYLECVIQKYKWKLGNPSLDTYLRRGKQIFRNE
jgi:hypothetical protein